MQNKPLHILKIDSSARNSDSYSRQLTTQLVNRLCRLYEGAQVTERVLPYGIPFLSASMIGTMFIPPANRQGEEDRALMVSDHLSRELKETNILVLGVPVYNFGIPASLKAYIDMVVRSGLTFKYMKDGPVGLVEQVRAFVVVTSGSTALRSRADFVSGYLETVLSFIGITDVQFIDATQIGLKGRDVIMEQALALCESLH